MAIKNVKEACNVLALAQANPRKAEMTTEAESLLLLAKVGIDEAIASFRVNE
jgi:hypothetical protein